MEKEYQKWHIKKSKVNKIEKRPFFHEREIWFCYLGSNIGFEQNGSEDFLRPVVILRKFNNEIFWAVPLTKSNKKINKVTEQFYYAFSFLPDIISVAILSQLRLIDAKRLSHQIGMIEDVKFLELNKKLKALLP